MISLTHLCIAAAILCNVTAQFLLKASVGTVNSPKLLGLQLNPFLLGGLAAYGISFYLTILIYKTFAVSTIGPFMMAVIVVLVAVLDKVINGTTFDPAKIIALSFIFIGICLLPFSKV